MRADARTHRLHAEKARLEGRDTTAARLTMKANQCERDAAQIEDNVRRFESGEPEPPSPADDDGTRRHRGTAALDGAKAIAEELAFRKARDERIASSEPHRIEPVRPSVAAPTADELKQLGATVIRPGQPTPPGFRFAN